MALTSTVDSRWGTRATAWRVAFVGYGLVVARPGCYRSVVTVWLFLCGGYGLVISIRLFGCYGCYYSVVMVRLLPFGAYGLGLPFVRWLLLSGCVSMATGYWLSCSGYCWVDTAQWGCFGDYRSVGTDWRFLSGGYSSAWRVLFGGERSTGTAFVGPLRPFHSYGYLLAVTIGW